MVAVASAPPTTSTLAVVTPLTRYMGRIGTLPEHSKGAWGFIDIETVTKENGEPRGLNPMFDIFIHKDDLGNADVLEESMELVFEIRPDQQRGEGCLRAHHALKVIAIDVLPEPAIPGFPIELAARDRAVQASQRHPAHFAMKTVDPATVAQAEANEPLRGVPRDEDQMSFIMNDKDVLIMLSHYLFSQFPGLHSLELSFEVVGYDDAAQLALLAGAVASCTALEMTDQAVLTQETYERFQATRTLLAWIYEQGWLQPGARLSPFVINSLLKLVEATPSGATKAQTVAELQRVFDFMNGHDLLRTSTVLPLRYLSDLFCAAPVWFFATDRSTTETALKSMHRSVSDPRLPRPIQDICALFPDNQRWSDTFLMFNRRLRPLSTFKGDVIPPAILRLIAEARTTFDHVIVMTPYLDIAGADWQDLAWLRSIDPYVIGIKRGCPVFFVLARFSDTGIFPLLSELVADTMTFLTANKDKLKNFNVVENPYWHGNTAHQMGTRLISQVDQMLLAFEAGHLFDWLRNEWTAETAAST